MEGSDFVDLLKKLYHYGTLQADAHYGSLTDNHGLKGFNQRRLCRPVLYASFDAI